MTTIYGNDAASVDAIDAEFLLKDDTDLTKILKLQLSGLTTGATRTLTVPDADGTIALTSGIPAAGIVSIDGVANAGGDVDLVAGSTKVSITPDDTLNKITLDVVEANLTLSNLGGAVTDAQVPDTITIGNLTQVTTKSHTVLSDIGTNTHAQIDTHIAAGAAGIVSFSVNKNGTAQTINSSVTNKVTWSTEDWDTNSNFAANAFTPTVAGKYHLTFGGSFTMLSSVIGYLEVMVYKNNAAHKNMIFHPLQLDGTVAALPVFSCDVDANGTTDYFEIFILNSTSNHGDLNGSSNYTFFQGYKVN